MRSVSQETSYRPEKRIVCPELYPPVRPTSVDEINLEKSVGAEVFEF